MTEWPNNYFYLFETLLEILGLKTEGSEGDGATFVF